MVLVEILFEDGNQQVGNVLVATGYIHDNIFTAFIADKLCY